MNYEDLITYLDIDDPSEFSFFEMMADLVECEENIEQEALYELFYRSDKATLSRLIDEYFEEVTNGLPDDSDGIYSLLDQIRLCLIGLISNAESESDIRRFTDEFYRFRDWYVYDSEVDIYPEDGGAEECLCLRDAITSARAEKVGGEEYRYDFQRSLDYEIDSYSMSFSELMAAEDDSDDK